MAPPPANMKVHNRRRKKKRTEDFSSDSSDSSDSDSDSKEEDKNEKPQNGEEVKEAQQDINIDDIDMESDSEKTESEPVSEPLPNDVQNAIRAIKFSSTANQNAQESKETLKKDKQQLENEYLAYMASTFGNDIDELRKKPDFTEKSIVILAKTLQSGSNMFDPETLDALLK